MSSSIPLSKVPEFFYSIPFANFQDTNYKHRLDIDELLATPAIGLATAHTLKKWRRLTQSARQRLLNARIAYAADSSSKNAEKFSNVSIEVVSIPSSLYDCLAMAKATDETHKGQRAAKKAYRNDVQQLLRNTTMQSQMQSRRSKLAVVLILTLY